MYRKGADELAAARAELVSYGTRLLDEDGTDHQETPSSETPMHLAIYAAASAAAVVHTHSPEVVALSASRPELPAIHYAITALGRPWPTGSPQPRPARLYTKEQMDD